MRRGAGQLFPLILLGLLAALSFWLERAVDLPEGRRDGRLRHDPDTYVSNFTVRRLDAGGVLKYHLVAPHMQHYGDDDSSLVSKPTLTSFRPDAPEVVLSGDQAVVTSKGEVVHLWGNVVARRAPDGQRPEMVARMPDLTVRPDDGIGFTDSPVEITQGESWIKGTGMFLDNNVSTLTLKSRVTGMYFKPKAPQ